MSWRGIVVRLAALILLVASVLAVKWKREETWPRVGQWHDLPSEDTSQLLALGYVEGSKEAPEMSGVTRYDREHAYDGVNLYVSGDDAKAYIIDMHGKLLHEWAYPRDQAFPRLSEFTADVDADRLYWRWVAPRPDGSIVAVYEGAGLVALDWRSRPLWTHQGFNHHDLDVLADGTIYALGRRRRVAPWLRPTPVIDDLIEVLSADGTLLRSISVLDALHGTNAESLLGKAPLVEDLLHTNAVRYLGHDKVLISIRELDALVTIDIASAKAVESRTGAWRRQHDPELLNNGHMLLFDNRGTDPVSRVIELDENGAIVWSYDKKPFYSETCGAAQRLANGATLITETETGRAFEVSAKGDIVWEYWNPHRTGDKRKLIAALFQVQRLPASYVTAR